MQNSIAPRWLKLATLCAVLSLNSAAFAQSGTAGDALSPPTFASGPAGGNQPGGSLAPAAVTTIDVTKPAPTDNARSLLSIIRDGGVVMFPLIACSFVLTVFLFERIVSLRRGRVIPGPFVKRFVNQLREGQLDREQALGLCEGNASPVSKVFLAAMKKWGKPAAVIDQAIMDAGERAANDLRRYLRVFNGLATVTPLLGLLGTVFGMIRSFSEISRSDGMGKAELLATGISEALFATATGLSIAIPSLVLYWFFVSRVDRLIMDMDALGQDIVGIISEEAIADGSGAKPTRVRRAAAAAA